MIILLMGSVAVAGVGWFGYKANKRIAAWGRNMNEIDGIFQTANAAEEEAEMQAVRSRAADDARAKAPFGGQHIPTRSAATR
jgi:hypothetical protein